MVLMKNNDPGNDDGGCPSPFFFRPVGPGGAVKKMDRMKIIKRRLSMSLRSARPVDDSLSELAEQMALDEPSTARDDGETHAGKNTRTLSGRHHTACIRTEHQPRHLGRKSFCGKGERGAVCCCGYDGE